MKFVTHSANFDEFFTVRTDREAPLMTAVNSDIARRLAQSGALIVAQTGNYSAGFHFDYATANTVGSVSVKPLELAAVHRNSPLPDQLADVALKIDVSEQWYPNGPPLGTFASVASSR